MGRFQYLFRFCCDPGHNRERELDSLGEFVKAMGADDVMVFCNVQELNTGQCTCGCWRTSGKGCRTA